MAGDGRAQPGVSGHFPVHIRQVSVTKQGFPRVAINLVLRCCLREPSRQNSQPLPRSPSLWERDSRLLLFPLLIAVHLVVKEVLRTHTQQSLSSPGSWEEMAELKS